MPSVGLVMEGGAMRGMFTAGVLDIFMENGVEFSASVGVSAGAAFGCNLKSRQIGRALRYNKRFSRDKRYCSVQSLLKTGDLYGADFCYREITEELDPFDKEAYERNPMAFYVVATDVFTGKAVYKRLDKADGNCYLWMRASASMPVAARPVEVEGYTLLDGGMSDAIPLRFMQDKGCQKNIVILTRPRDFVIQPVNKILVTPVMHKYPVMIEAAANRHKMYSFKREYVFACEKQGSTLVLCPDQPLNVSLTEKDPEKLQEAYDEGVKVALRELDKIKAFTS